MGPLSSALARLVLLLWAGLLVLIGGTLAAGHWVTLPAPPEADPALEAAIATSRRPPEQGRWLALHVLYDQCRCSQRIADVLLSTARPSDLSERVLLIHRPPPDPTPPTDIPSLATRITTAGFGLEAMTPEQLLERYTISAAPLLLVIDPQGQVRYSGGYTDRKQGPVTRDREIIAAARAGDTALARLPLFGCAVSQSLQDALDPLGIKY